MDSGRASTGGRRQARLRRAFLAFEVGLSLVLLVGAGLLVRSFGKVLSVDPGFDPSGVLAADLPLARVSYPDRAAQLRFAQESLRRLRAEPELEAAGYVSRLPFSPIVAAYTVTRANQSLRVPTSTRICSYASRGMAPASRRIAPPNISVSAT